MRIEGPDVFPVELPLTADADGRCELSVDRSAVMQLVDGPWAAGELVLFDQAENEVECCVVAGGRRVRGKRWPVRNGSSPELLIPTSARELAVFVDAQEVLRIPLSLRAGERMLVRP